MVNIFIVKGNKCQMYHSFYCDYFFSRLFPPLMISLLATFYVKTKGTAGSEKKNRFIFLEWTGFSFVISKWMWWPHYLIARMARIFQAFDVLLNVLSHVAGIFWSVSTGFAIIPIHPLFNHWFNSGHCGRFNEWIQFRFLWICHQHCLFKWVALIFKQTI